MRCALPHCRRRAGLVVDFGEGLMVLLCGDDAVSALVDEPRRRVRTLRGGSSDVVIRPRGA